MPLFLLRLNVSKVRGFGVPNNGKIFRFYLKLIIDEYV